MFDPIQFVNYLKYMGVGMKIENEKQRNRNNNDFLADASTKLLSEKEKLDSFSNGVGYSGRRPGREYSPAAPAAVCGCPFCFRTKTDDKNRCSRVGGSHAPHGSGNQHTGGD